MNYSFANWTHDQFIRFCILCGCDYLKNLPKVAIKNIYKIYTNNRQDIRYVFDELATKVGNANFSADYIESFQRAYLTFKYQRVWCPKKHKMVSLNSIMKLDIFTEKDFEEIVYEDRERLKLEHSFNDQALLAKFSKMEGGLNFLGPILEHEIMVGIAHCKIDPISKEAFKKPSSYSNIITDKKYDDLKSLASKVLETKNSSKSESLSFFKLIRADKKEAPQSNNILTTFFPRSQSQLSKSIPEKSVDQDDNSNIVVEQKVSTQIQEIKFDGNHSAQKIVNKSMSIEKTPSHIDKSELFSNEDRLERSVCEDGELSTRIPQNTVLGSQVFTQKEIIKTRVAQNVSTTFLSQQPFFTPEEGATQPTSLTSSKKKVNETLSAVFAKYRVEQHKSITEQTISNFRKGYLATLHPKH
jgi:hypothetical protein